MKEKMLQEFKRVYGEDRDVKVYFAPGRVNLIGEHTDYNGGHVFPCALTMGTYAAVRRRDDNKLRFYSANFDKLGVIETSLDDLVWDKAADWTNYPKGGLICRRATILTRVLICAIWEIYLMAQDFHHQLP